MENYHHKILLLLFENEILCNTASSKHDVFLIIVHTYLFNIITTTTTTINMLSVLCEHLFHLPQIY